MNINSTNYDPVKHGTIVKIRTFYSEGFNGTMVELSFSLGGTTIFPYRDEISREKFSSGIDSNTIYVDERFPGDSGSYHFVTEPSHIVNDKMYKLLRSIRETYPDIPDDIVKEYSQLIAKIEYATTLFEKACNNNNNQYASNSTSRRPMLFKRTSSPEEFCFHMMYRL